MDHSFYSISESVLKFIVHLCVFASLWQIVKDIESKYDELILGLAGAIEAKDGYTRDHVDRVRELSVRLGRALGLPEEEVKKIKIAVTLQLASVDLEQGRAEFALDGLQQSLSIARRTGNKDLLFRSLMLAGEIGSGAVGL